MSKEAPQPDYAGPEWQAWCAQHFRPDIDLDELETAQRQHREVLELLAATLPFEEWLASRPPYVKPEQWGAWLEALQAMTRELEERAPLRWGFFIAGAAKTEPILVCWWVMPV